jgi:hypothetical protein
MSQETFQFAVRIVTVLNFALLLLLSGGFLWMYQMVRGQSRFQMDVLDQIKTYNQMMAQRGQSGTPGSVSEEMMRAAKAGALAALHELETHKQGECK